MCVISYSARGKYFILLASSFMFPVSVSAQCIATSDCATLGYTETSCPNGKGIKCPFGDKWACPSSKEETCTEYGFKYDCSGTGYQSGSGTPCNNKYASCTCASGYEWKNDKCEKKAESPLGKCTGKAKNCKIADILYTDGTCSADVISGKTPIAIVVYISSDNCGQALALEGLGSYQWSTEKVDISELNNWTSENDEKNDFSSCENTKIVIDYSNKRYDDDSAYKYYYPAFSKAYDYAPSAMPETKGKWCLPSYGVLNNIYQNKTAIDQSLTRINKENIGANTWWSSAEYSFYGALSWRASSGGYGINYKDSNYYTVRPVIEF